MEGDKWGETCPYPSGEMVDTLVLGTSVDRRVGSSPTLGTKIGCAVQMADGRWSVKPVHRNAVGSNPTTPTLKKRHEYTKKNIEGINS